MLLHVGRDRTGRRRLAEIAVLRRTSDGALDVLTAWHADTGFGCGAEILQQLIVDRGAR
ncbi:conjugal transfer protein TrbB [Mycolicibacterium wolinskyi]|uniref:conjugal transfer protein TrbB n=1 Tax=Mycolicibacterium wolinskyi TaxID=59750 RepID=UPI0039178091